MRRDAVLLVVDIQNDFLPGGALAVARGDEVIAVINRIAARFDNVLLTQDWHTRGHISFASSHPGQEPFATIELPYGHQILWPDHCVQGTRGAALADDLDIPHAQGVIRKGFHAHTDSYSAFLEADRKTPTGLAGLLNERGMRTVYLAGRTCQPRYSIHHDALSEQGLASESLGGFDGEWIGSGPALEVITPVDGTRIATVRQVTEAEYERIVARAHQAFLSWRSVPAPRRGDLVRHLGNRLREHKQALGALVTLEMGKILPEGEGEVQAMIDICDFAVGLSRQLYGLTMPSERQDHRMAEQWHPLGVIGVITSFNFPTAVWSWNTALACVCGDSVVWKPASKTPLTAIATTKLAQQVCIEHGVDPAIFSLVNGKGATVGERMLHDQRLPLISFTGSSQMGRHVSQPHGGWVISR